MKHIVLATCVFLVFNILPAQNLTNDATFSVGDGTNTTIFKIAKQADGKIIAGGIFNTFNGTNSRRLVRINTDGSIDAGFAQGSKIVGSVQAIVVQPDGKILVGGSFSTYDGIAVGEVFRLNSDGTFDGTFQTNFGANSIVYAMALQADGKIVVAGDFTTVSGNSYNKIARLQTNGDADASFQIGSGITGSSGSAVKDIKIDNNGKIVAVGLFSSFNGSTVSNIVRIKSNGAKDNSFSASTDDIIQSVVLQSSGNMYIGGNFNTINGVAKSKIGRLTSSGIIDNTFNIGTGFDGEIYSLCLLPNNTILAGGFFNEYNGQACSYLAGISTTGAYVPSFSGGDNLNSGILDINFESLDKIYVAGSFTNYGIASTNRIARLKSCATQGTTSSHTSCNNYTWYGQVLTTSGVYAHNLTNAQGCDSIIYLNFTKTPITSTINVSNCYSYTWFGTTYVESGAYTHNIPNGAASGCDSTITLNLTITTTSNSTTNITSCGSYVWNGTAYNTTGTYSATLTGASYLGCDSVATVNLTIKNIATSSTSINSNSAYTWNGTTYNASGTYNFTVSNGGANGCDSIATLVLTLDNSGNNATSGFVGVGTTTPNSTLSVAGSVSTNLRQVTTSNSVITLTAGDHKIMFSGNTSNNQCILPSAANIRGREYTITNKSTSAIDILNYGSTLILPIQTTVTLFSNGSAWNVLSNVIAETENTLPISKGGTGTALAQPNGQVIVAGANGVYTSSSNLVLNNSTQNLGVGTNNPNSRLTVNSANNGTGTNNWIAGNFGGTAGPRVVAGVNNGLATIGAHNNALTQWDTLSINETGRVKIPSLGGSGTPRFVTADTFGLLSTAMPIASGANTGFLTPLDWTRFNNKADNYGFASAANPGILSHTDWQVFNNKQEPLGYAGPSANGILSAADWNTFNNKMSSSSIPNASHSQTGLLTNTDWITFNNKYTLPSLSNNGVVFSNGSTLVTNHNKLHWDNTNFRLGVGISANANTLEVYGVGGIKVTTDQTQSGTTDWIAGDFGAIGSRVVVGSLNGNATIGAHSGIPYTWDNLYINTGGDIFMPSINTTNTTRMVTVDQGGKLSSAVITGSGNVGTVTNVLAGAGTPLSVTNGTTTPSISITQANTSTNGYLSSTDWNTFNNKFTLPSLTSGSILFSDGTTLAQSNSSLNWSNGIGRINISGLNNGTIGAGYTNWISSNIGGSGGDRIVMGVANGKATIGAHNNGLSAWSDLVLNPVSSNTVTIGSSANENPTAYNSSLTGNAGTNLIVKGSIRQGYYSKDVSISAGSTITITWNHNLGYKPVVMMSTDEGTSGNMIDVIYTVSHNANNNTSTFKLKNTGTTTASGDFRWILVW